MDRRFDDGGEFCTMGAVRVRRYVHISFYRIEAKVLITDQQKDLVQSTWKDVAPISEKAASLFYGKLFELDPSLRPMFKGDIAEQGRKLMVMLGTAVRGLDDLGELTPAVAALGKRHVGYGVENSHYDTVGAALLWTLEQGLGDKFTDQVREAWTVVYTTLATVMQQAADGETSGATGAVT